MRALGAALVDGEEQGTVERLNLLVRHCRATLSSRWSQNEALSCADKEERARKRFIS